MLIFYASIQQICNNILLFITIIIYYYLLLLFEGIEI